MSNTVEKNFSGFVKVVIGATGLLAMGAVVASGAMVKGFKEGVKSVRDSLNDQDEKTDKKSENTESTETSDGSEAAADNTSETDEENGFGC